MFFHFIRLSIISTFFLSTVFALSGKEIMQKVEDQSHQHQSQTYDVKMILTNKKNQSRERFFSIKKQINTNNIKSLIKFYKPANIKGTGLLTIQQTKKDHTQQKVFLPALRNIKVLSTKDTHKSFMGSDFTNSDIAGRPINKDKHQLTHTDDNFYYITSIPKQRDDLYSRLELQIHKTTMTISKIDFYNQKDFKIKTLQNLKLKKKQGMYIVSHSKMSNHQQNTTTDIKVNNINLNEKFSRMLFSNKGLSL